MGHSVQGQSGADHFWQRLLSGFSSPTPLTVDQTRGGSLGIFEAQAVNLGEAISNALREFAANRGLTVDCLLQGAWAGLLARYSGEPDVVFGLNRRRKCVSPGELAELSASAVPVRIQFGPDEPVSECLSRLQGIQDVLQESAPVPASRFREWCDVPDNMPLFTTAVVMENDTGAVLPDGGSEVTAPASRPDGSPCPLVLVLSAGRDVGLRICFDPQRFHSDTVARMCGHIRTLLNGFVTDSGLPLSLLPLLTNDERHQVLVEWNDTKAPFPSDSCLHELFEAHARERPGATAVCFRDEHVTYAEVNSRANQLAHHLRGLGVGPEVLVGLCVDRSVEMVVGMLGILKAGGAYVPVEPTYPKSRIQFMLEDTKVSVLLTQQFIAENLPLVDTQVICLDDDWGEIARCPDDTPETSVTAQNLAYVIFTSGSTGRPKGIALRHQGVINNLFDLNTSFDVGVGDKVLAISALSFDMCVYEVLGTLAAGGTIVMPDPRDAKDPRHWAELVIRHGVTVWNSAPQLLEMFVDHVESQSLRERLPIRVAILGGDWVPVTLPDRLKALTDGVQVVVLGGATEASIHSIVYVVEQTDPDWRSIPYGKPMKNQRAYILDARLQPVPIGVPGELHLGGVGLARGYFNRPELTKQKFVPSPFSDDPGDRLYKTGDLARFMTDGNIELLGRMDNQVKIRGHRIELEEITAVLRDDPGVQEAVVVVREDQPGERRLVAYVVSSPDVEVSGPSASADQVAQWKTVYDETYGKRSHSTNAADDFIGWVSSYTGLAFPAEELREMVDNTGARILTLRPNRVFEIGCGTGLILFRVAPHTMRYDAMDISSVAVTGLQRHLSEHSELSNVSVRLGSADDFDTVPTGVYDTVILNSVLQHFPDIGYLKRVIRGAVKIVAPPGVIFVGDVRSFPLLEVFHASIELHRASGDMAIPQLRRRLLRRMSLEKELTVDPAFFTRLEREIPEISHVAVRLKRGTAETEFNKFHYDVIIGVGHECPGATDAAWLDWDHNALTIAEVRRRLAEDRPEVYAVTNVPNQRVRKDVQALGLVREENGLQTVGELRDALEESGQGDGVDPEDFWRAAEAFSYTVDIRWSATGGGTYDVVLKCRNGPAIEGDVCTAPPFPEEIEHHNTRHHLGNTPVEAKGAGQLAKRLRHLTSETLPGYMVPESFVLLDAFPLTPNGKVDRRALPPPDEVTGELKDEFVAPRNSVEAALAAIWCDVLNLEQVCVHESLFDDLGGHSLKATQIVSRIRNELQVTVPLRTVFDHPTVAQLAEAVAVCGWEVGVDVSSIAELLAQVHELSDAEAKVMLAERTEDGAR